MTSFRKLLSYNASSHLEGTSLFDEMQPSRREETLTNSTGSRPSTVTRGAPYENWAVVRCLGLLVDDQKPSSPTNYFSRSVETRVLYQFRSTQSFERHFKSPVVAREARSLGPLEVVATRFDVDRLTVVALAYLRHNILTRDPNGITESTAIAEAEPLKLLAFEDIKTHSSIKCNAAICERRSKSTSCTHLGVTC